MCVWCTVCVCLYTVCASTTEVWSLPMCVWFTVCVCLHGVCAWWCWWLWCWWWLWCLCVLSVCLVSVCMCVCVCVWVYVFVSVCACVMPACVVCLCRYVCLYVCVCICVCFQMSCVSWSICVHLCLFMYHHCVSSYLSNQHIIWFSLFLLSFCLPPVSNPPYHLYSLLSVHHLISFLFITWIMINIPSTHNTYCLCTTSQNRRVTCSSALSGQPSSSIHADFLNFVLKK